MSCMGVVLSRGTRGGSEIEDTCRLGMALLQSAHLDKSEDTVCSRCTGERNEAREAKCGRYSWCVGHHMESCSIRPKSRRCEFIDRL
jgi:hypothetical protein